MKNIFLLVSFLLCINCKAQTAYNVYLVGDAGDDDLPGETLDSLRANLLQHPNSAVIFLGDNCYRKFPFQFRGFDSSRITQKRILSQLQILTDYKGSVFFVPGNHDWWNTTNFLKGQKNLKMEENFIEQNMLSNHSIQNNGAVFLPTNGNPGPTVVEADHQKICLVFIDTQWLLLSDSKQMPAAEKQKEKEFYDRLDSVLTQAENKHQQIIVAAHHPVKAVDGSLCRDVKHPQLFSRLKMSITGYPTYKRLIKNLTDVFEKHDSVYFVSGHVHALQFYNTGHVQYIVSGAGSKVLKGHEPNPPCNSLECRIWKQSGFFVLSFEETATDVFMFYEAGRKQKKINE